MKSRRKMKEVGNEKDTIYYIEITDRDGTKRQIDFKYFLGLMLIAIIVVGEIFF